jgi:uncharacterized protein YbjT (DUF2867 family)
MRALPPPIRAAPPRAMGRAWPWLLAALACLGLVLAWALTPPSTASGLETARSEPAPKLAASAPISLRILVIGASSGIGRETAQLASARGHRVIGLARRPPTPTSEPAGTSLSASPTPPATDAATTLELRQGDIQDADAVADAARDVDAIVISIGAPMGREPVSVFSRGMRNVLAALEGRPGTTVVSVTGIGAGDSRGHGGFGYDRILWPLLLREIYLDKDREEAALRVSPVRYTIVRPGFLTDDDSDAPYRIVTQVGELRAGAISRRQVAEFMLATIEQDLYSRQTVLLTR